MTKEFGALIADPAALSARLARRPPPTEDELGWLLHHAWIVRASASCEAVCGRVELDTLRRHLATTVSSIGLSARLYLEFLVGAGGLRRLAPDDRQALLAGASSADMRDVVARGG